MPRPLLARLNFPRLIGTIAIGLVLAGILAIQALSSVLTRAEPGLAVSLFSGNGLAAEQHASRLFEASISESGDEAQAALAASSPARRAIALDPLVPKSFALLAMAQPDVEARRAIVAEAGRLNRRELSLQGLALQDNLALADYSGVIAGLDQILRVHPEFSGRYFLPLLETLRIEEASGLFPDILTGAAPWHRSFLLYAVRDPQARVQLAAIRRDLTIADPEFDRALISGLAEQGEIGRAERLYTAIAAAETGPADANAPARGAEKLLVWSSAFPPFDWSLADERGFRAQASRDGTQLELYARSGQGGVIARRILGETAAPFALRTTVDLGPVQRPERLRLVLRCGFGGDVAGRAALLDYPLGDGANTVVVPAEASDCERLVLAIEARSRLGEPALRSEIGRIRISPLR